MKLQPIDIVAFIFIGLLSMVIGVSVWQGEICSVDCWLKISPRVQEFSWQDSEIGAEDTAFVITFDRPMDRISVEKNLTIEPPLPGKISWAGRRLAYTLNAPAPYGQSYRLTIKKGKDKNNQQVLQPFLGSFTTRERAFAYISTEKTQEGQLVLYNWTRKIKSIITPPNLIVTDFKSYPKGEAFLFAAIDRLDAHQNIQNVQLYKAILDTDASQETPPKIQLVLDSQEYQNNQFELSPDGKSIIVQRINKKNPADFDLWLIKDEMPPTPLKTSGGIFVIAPDSKTVAVAQGEGISIIALEAEAKPLDFLPKYGQVLSFSRDGSSAAMINFNKDNAQLRYTRTLYYVNNVGLQKPLLNIEGSILDCQFTPTNTSLYCLMTELIKGEQYREQPYFAEVNFATNKVTPIVVLPEYQDITMSVAADGLAILFDQVDINTQPNPGNVLTTESGLPIAKSSLWVLIPSTSQLEELPLAGFHPQWLP